MTVVDTAPSVLRGASWWQAREAAHACAGPLGVEQIAVADAAGRVLALDVRAATPLPAFAASAMDGWAVRGTGPWRLVGTVLAGSAPACLADGEAVVIATGARLPDGADGVLRSEDGAVRDGAVDGHVRAGDHVRPAGEECAADELLVAAGTRLRPTHLGLAAAAGHDRLAVVRRPCATVLVLGDEILDAGPARDGRVRDALGPQLPAWLSAIGVEPIGMRRVPDTERALVAALRDAAAHADIVITTGGTAAGPVDHLHRALETLGGRLVVDSVRVRPGHPMLLAVLPGAVPVVGLPGNPQAALVGLATLAVPLVEALVARPLPALGDAVAAADVGAPARSTRLVPARLAAGCAAPVGHDGPAMLRGLADADGWLVVPPGGSRAGDAVPWLPLPS